MCLWFTCHSNQFSFRHEQNISKRPVKIRKWILCDISVTFSLAKIDINLYLPASFLVKVKNPVYYIWKPPDFSLVKKSGGLSDIIKRIPYFVWIRIFPAFTPFALAVNTISPAVSPACMIAVNIPLKACIFGRWNCSRFVVWQKPRQSVMHQVNH